MGKRKKENFYALQLMCPVCRGELGVIGVEFSVKGSIKIETLCLVCEEPSVVVTSWGLVIGICAETEKEEATGFMIAPETRKLQ